MRRRMPSFTRPTWPAIFPKRSSCAGDVGSEATLHEGHAAGIRRRPPPALACFSRAAAFPIRTVACDGRRTAE
jgi:hypothetical protein